MKTTLHLAAPLLLMLHAARAHQTALCVSTTPNRCEEAIMWFVTWHQGADRAQRGTVTITNTANGATTSVSLASTPYCMPTPVCNGCDLIAELKSDCQTDYNGHNILGMDADAEVACYGVADVSSTVTKNGVSGLITKRIDLSMGTASSRAGMIWSGNAQQGYNSFTATLTGVNSEYYIVTSANTDVVMDPQGAVGHPAQMQNHNIAVLIEAPQCGTDPTISCDADDLPDGLGEFSYNNAASCDDAFVGKICSVTCSEAGNIPNGMVQCGANGQWVNTIVCATQYVQTYAPPSPPPGGSIKSDPHLTLAYGGKADFRGLEGNGLFNLLSAAGLSLNALFSGAMFKLREVVVDGSFMTEAHLVARTASGKDFKLSYDAAALTDHESWRGAQMVTATCGDDRLPAVTKGSIRCDNLEAIVDANKLEFKNEQWLIEIKGEPVYNRISGPHHRVDIAFLPVADTLRGKTHGLVGQSFDGSEVPRYGRLDQYPPLDKPADFKTSAMAEGAIEGVAADYQVADKFATAFKFSHFAA